MNSIQFFTEDINYRLRNKNKIREWIQLAIDEHHKKIDLLNYIFTSDNYLLALNQDFLQHDTYTDIITFDHSSDSNVIEADIFISLERIKENARKFNSNIPSELHRVMIHGVLHLLGFKDKTVGQKSEMRKREDHYLALRFN